MKEIEKAKKICGELRANCYKDCEHCINSWEMHDLLEMAAWKEQQMIEKAVEYLEKNLCDFWQCKYLDDISFIKDFKKAMRNRS